MVNARVGFALDAALLCVTAYLLSQSPVAQDVRASGVAVLSTLADGPMAGNITRTALFTDPVSNKWFEFVFGSNLGRYAASNADLPRIHAINAWLNTLLLPAAVVDAVPHMLAIWLRNCLAGWAMYYIVGGVWSFAIYTIGGTYFFPDAADKPSWDAITTQMRVSSIAMVGYSFMPTLGEWFMERGWTFAYLDLDVTDVKGAATFAACFAAYIFLVEWGIYWAHRGLHEHKGLYMLLHRPHHIYNNKNSLSPFAGLAFHPIDGMIQASPYVIFLFALPVHFWVHLGMLFFTGVWTTNIHDTINGHTEPLMGAAYHTLHHTKYTDNYGQFFTFFDWVHDTLLRPDAGMASKSATQKHAAAKGVKSH